MIEAEGGFTQDEQIAELEAVVELMQEYFGEDVATIDGEPWTAQRHDEEVPARPNFGVYRHVINFDVPYGDLGETYTIAEEIASQLGLTENINNSHGVNNYGKIYYGAGREEGRIFLIASNTTADGFRATYQTRESDHETIISAYERVIESRIEEDEYGPDDPRGLEYIEERRSSGGAEE